jgi:hypothetical protein
MFGQFAEHPQTVDRALRSVMQDVDLPQRQSNLSVYRVAHANPLNPAVISRRTEAPRSAHPSP